MGDAASRHAAAWSIDPSVVYLNHGSFGPAPRVVREEQRRWLDLLQTQPMDFLARHWHERLDQACQRLGEFVGTAATDLVPVDNSTAGMNAVADSFALEPGDEVLLNDHEYGAVRRIWQRACGRADANLRETMLSRPLRQPQQVVEALLADITPRTRLVVVSHITSPTALIFPVAELCRQLRERSVALCIDGPHALAVLPLRLRELDCDYYTASCHKWLAAPIGSGFLYVHPRRQAEMQPPVLSWGRPAPQAKPSWCDEFTWSGTRDLSAFLSVPRAIEFLEAAGLDEFRRHGHELATYARRQIAELTGLEPLVPEGPEWYGTMAAMPLPPGDAEGLHQTLRHEHGIEVPVFEWQGRRLLRVSCHWYNTEADLDRLMTALRAEL
jgi:isopenicillin-N epimerase